MKKNFYFFGLFFCLFLITGCESCRKNKNNAPILKVDRQKAAEVQLALKINRFDQDLMEDKKVDIKLKTDQLLKKYGSFFTLFSSNIINIGPPKHPSFERFLNDFITDKTICEIYDEVKKEYTDISALELEFSKAFSHYRVLFPEKQIPKLISFLSGFNYAIITTDSVLGIGLDMFLGDDSKFYSLLGMPKYKIRAMRKEMIVADGMRSWISTEFEKELPKEDLLSLIIQEGKYLYILDNVLPDAPDSVKIGFSAKETDWCQKSEGSIWKFIVDKKLLFSSDYKENMKWVKESPFTAGLPRESPGRVGLWVGWQIVRSYMKNNPDVSLNDLISNLDAQDMLNRSKYRPITR